MMRLSNPGRSHLNLLHCARHASALAGLLWALVAPCAAADAPTDARGFIDVWALRADLRRLGVMPTGDVECREWEGDEEPVFKTAAQRRTWRQNVARLQREHQRCTREQERLAAIYQQARDVLNQRWRPALQRAMERGDGVAEVILRLCETAPPLDRSGIAADCSESAADQATARQRLEAIGFQPALLRAGAARPQPADARSRCGHGDAPATRECRHLADIARYDRILNTMAAGLMGEAQGHIQCQMRDPDPRLDDQVEHCHRSAWLMMAMGAEARRFYTVNNLRMSFEHAGELSLMRQARAGASGETYDEERFASRKLPTRNDFTPFSDPQFGSRFWAELRERLAAADARIEADLRREPRWAAFLIERVDGRLYDAGAKPAAPDPAWEKKRRDQVQAEAEQKESESWEFKPVSELIASLHRVRNEQLYYDSKSFPGNLKTLQARNGTTPALIAAFKADSRDELFRFNLVILMSKRLVDPRLTEDERNALGDTLAGALKDRAAWVRTEAADALFNTRDRRHIAALQALAADPDADVRKAAARSAARLESFGRR